MSELLSYSYVRLPKYSGFRPKDFSILQMIFCHANILPRTRPLSSYSLMVVTCGCLYSYFLIPVWRKLSFQALVPNQCLLEEDYLSTGGIYRL